MSSNESFSNKEKEDILAPIEGTIDNLGEITLYQSAISPPCCKLRMIFSYYKLKFVVIDGKKPNSEYKKIPVVVVKNKQINDSFIIVKSLAQILDGQELTPELLALEEMNTYELMISLELHTASSCVSLLSCARKMNFCVCVLLSTFSCCICCCAPISMRSKFPNVKSVIEYNALYSDILGEKEYFHGSSPGIVDISLCGILAPFLHANVHVADEFLGTSGCLFEWHSRLRSRLPNIF